MFVCFISTRSKLFSLNILPNMILYYAVNQIYSGSVISLFVYCLFSNAGNKCQQQQRHGLPCVSCFSFNHAGIIRTALADMDREAREHYTVVIQAKDMAGQVGGLSGSTTINITLTDINDNPPKFPQSMYTLLSADGANAQYRANVWWKY